MINSGETRELVLHDEAECDEGARSDEEAVSCTWSDGRLSLSRFFRDPRQQSNCSSREEAIARESRPIARAAIDRGVSAPRELLYRLYTDSENVSF
ncbi:Hypothetical protein NTJ_05192 [Nesidiocoris tenuis]|uniref:Uncharacterized protein n=1 Tax=Nesidiocoris tenuis TaxID=355587 RepID=A0ABN7AJE4_9HEMI|nr:Hypothetical protein NTJ_05192 [Nesidiocoris tenuis]